MYAGLYANAGSLSTVQGSFDGINYDSQPWYEFEEVNATYKGYSNSVFPTASLTLLSVHYYDHYDFDRNGSADYTYDNAHLSGQESSASSRTRGLATGSTRVIINSNETLGSWLTTAIFYDQYDRPIQAQGNNHQYPTGLDKQTIIYDFVKVLKTKTTQRFSSAASVDMVERMDHDHAGRILKIYHAIGATEQTVAEYIYNPLGQLSQKKLHKKADNSFIQAVDYTYTIGGALKKINDPSSIGTDYFAQELIRNESLGGMSQQQSWNGNITAVKWKEGYGDSGGDLKAFAYQYYKNDQMKEAKYAEGASFASDVNAFNESDITYDANGNIRTLQRNGKNNLAQTAMIDYLSYTYSATNANSLLKVEDTGTSAGFANGVTNNNEYAYDANGNITQDKNKGVDSVKYNALGKVRRVRFSDGRVQTYVYDAAGQRLTSRTYANTGILQKRSEFVGGFQYEDGTLLYQPSPEGRVVRTGGSLFNAAQSQCVTTSGFAVQAGTVSTVVQNGETYVKVVANGGLTGPGVNAASVFPVQANKKYVFKMKGYVQAGAAYQPMMYINTNIGGILGHPNTIKLPIGATNEDWISHEFTTQAGATQLYAGIFWSFSDNIPAGYEFYLNKVELIPITDEYQYAITDHQGNTRIVFSSVTGAPKVSTANMESGTNAEFSNYANVFRSSVNLYDHTDAYPASSSTYSNLLNGGNNQQIGVAKTYRVVPGDKVKIEAYAKFSNLTGTASNLANFATALLSAFGASTPVSGEIGTVSSALNTYGGIVASGNGPTSTGPKAFVNILIFDKNYNFLDVAYQAIDPSAEQVGVSPVVPHDYVGAEYTIKEAGYVYMYVSNENATRVDVYFDDIVMTHTPGNVIQYNEYYPFGMRTAASWDRVEDKPVPSIATGLVAKLMFDGNAQDGSGNGNHGTMSGGPLIKTDQGRPSVILMDGTDDYVQINDNASLDFGANDFSIAIWVKKLAPTSSHDNREVIHKWNNTQPVGSNEWLLATTSDGTDSKVRFHVSQGAVYTTVTTTDELVIGNWYHLSVIRAGSMLKVYINGVLKASANIGAAAINNAGNNMLIGKAFSGLQTNAAYDDFYIYNRALTEEELRYLYQNRPDLMVNNYLYNAGSEFNDQTGSYEMYFRNYDPVLARMSGVDVMADAYSSLTPYQYSNNDPVYFNDPTGAYAGGDEWWNGPRDFWNGKDPYRSEPHEATAHWGSSDVSFFAGSRYGIGGRYGSIANQAYIGYRTYTLTIDMNQLSDGAHVFDFTDGLVSNYTFYSDADIAGLGMSLLGSIVGASYNPTGGYAGGPRLWGNAGGTVFTIDPNTPVQVVTGKASPVDGAPDSWVPVYGDYERAVYWAGYDDWSRVALYGASAAMDLAGIAGLARTAVKTGARALIGRAANAATKEAPTIVGEGMKRVSAAAAQNPGATILNNMPKFTGTADQIASQMMTYNRQWILQQMRSGRPILDIGLDPTRGAPSIFYQMEQNMMKNYLKLHPGAF